MTKSRLLVDYEIVEMSGTKLAIFKNGKMVEKMSML